MNVYYIKGFPGHYPVGTSAVIVASSRLEAFALLQKELTEHGLALDLRDVNSRDFIQLNVLHPHAIVLNDGNY